MGEVNAKTSEQRELIKEYGIDDDFIDHYDYSKDHSTTIAGHPDFSGFCFNRFKDKMADKGYMIFFALQGIGGLGFILSGFMYDNAGRFQTGLGQVAKNLFATGYERRWPLLGKLEKIGEENVRALFMALSFVVHIPHLAASFTLPNITIAEKMSTSAVVIAYLLLTAPGVINVMRFFFFGKKTQFNEQVKPASSLKRSLREKGKKALFFVTIIVAPMLLFSRALAQFWDGLERFDIPMIFAGICLCIAAIPLALGVKKELGKMLHPE